MTKQIEMRDLSEHELTLIAGGYAPLPVIPGAGIKAGFVPERQMLMDAELDMRKVFRLQHYGPKPSWTDKLHHP